MATNIDKYVEPSEIPASVAVPLGGFMPWWPTVAGTPGAPPTPPTGFEYCDGTAVSTVGSPYFGFAKPSIMVTPSGGTLRMVRGVDTVATAIGGATAHQTNGADTHVHSGSTNSAGNHSHTVNAHGHTFTTASSGSHSHTLPVGSGEITFNPGMPSGRLATTNSAGTHSHTGTTDNASPGTNFQGNHSHSLSVSSASTIPAVLQVAWIVRVL